ncbi:MAG: O-antigen ligase family protein [Actinomycetota bacterium]|nr:O-antigen ligase family protein [Actinomycetota bacterium]
MSFTITSSRGAHPRDHAAGSSFAGLSLATIGPVLGQAVLPFLLIVYLGMRGGGYDGIVRGEVGIAAWWIVLVGAAVGALPAQRLGRAGIVSLGLLAAFAAWTALGIGWSESAERSVAELGRVASLLGVFALALTLQGPGAIRRVCGGVAGGIALIGLVALLSRLHPAWFPELEVPKTVEGAQARLHYPLNYWNGLAAFMAMGVPLLLALSTVLRSIAARAVAISLIPALSLTAFFTLSRGGFVELAVALVVLVCLHPKRAELAALGLVAALGSAILIVAANQRTELTDGLTNAAATSQGNEMIAMSIVVCVGVGLIAAAVGLVFRYVARPEFGGLPRPTKGVLAAGVAGVLAISVVAGAPGAISDGWENFKDPEVPTSQTARFDSSGGSGRYQWWSSAVDANATDPLVGIGPGTFEFWWARESTIPAFVRDAHSLYLETFAELGLIGLILILGVVGTPFVAGLRRISGASTEQRILVAGALAACAAFVTAAALEWVWELTVLPVAFLLLAAALVGLPRGSGRPPRKRLSPRLLLAGLAACGLVAIAIPIAGASAIRDSQSQVRAQDYSAALDQANAAATIQPYAASASIQEALVLELQGDFDAAVAAARMATEEEATNWRTWLVLSRLEARAGNADASVAAYREARSLNPNSAIFQ